VARRKGNLEERIKQLESKIEDLERAMKAMYEVKREESVEVPKPFVSRVVKSERGVKLVSDGWGNWVVIDRAGEPHAYARRDRAEQVFEHFVSSQT
jgi:hypothetical protein